MKLSIFIPKWAERDTEFSKRTSTIVKTKESGGIVEICSGHYSGCRDPRNNFIFLRRR